jgi:hypothetical protein
MAKFKPIQGEIIGSLGAVTYSRNRYGLYVKARAVPHQPNTSDQMFARAVFLDGTTGWRTLSESVRKQWNDYAAMTQTQLPDGRTGFLTGQNWYVAHWGVCGQLGVAPQPPAPGAGVLPLPSLNEDNVDRDGNLNIPKALFPADATHCLAWGVVTSPGRKKASGPWTLYFKGPIPVGGVAFVGAVAGQRWFIRLRLYSNTKKITSPIGTYGPFDIV